VFDDAGFADLYPKRGHLPEAGPKRDAYAAQVGADGFQLLDALDVQDAAQDAWPCPSSGCCVGCPTTSTRRWRPSAGR